MATREKKLVFFLELGGSLSRWDSAGILERELAPYNILASHFKAIYIVSYGNVNDLTYKKLLHPNIHVLTRKLSIDNPILNFLYELILPFKYWKILSDCDIYKSNQNLGSLAPTIAKILHPSKYLVIRSGYIGSLNAKLANLPLHVRLYYFLVEPLSYLLCNTALIPERHNQLYLLQRYPFLKNRCIVHNNAIDTDLFKPIVVNKRYDIVYVARFDRDKNHQLIINATRDTRINILFIGQGAYFHEVRKSLLGSIAKITIIERIPNNELPLWLNAAKLCVFPSLHEGNPKALLEAMSCELPIIALDVIGVNNIIQHNITGVLLPKNVSPSDFQQSIMNLLNNQNQQKTFGVAARKVVLAHYSLQSQIKKELLLYAAI